jgi:hypothetical protein
MMLMNEYGDCSFFMEIWLLVLMLEDDDDEELKYAARLHVVFWFFCSCCVPLIPLVL